MLMNCKDYFNVRNAMLNDVLSKKQDGNQFNTLQKELNPPSAKQEYSRITILARIYYTGDVCSWDLFIWTYNVTAKLTLWSWCMVNYIIHYLLDVW